MMQSFGGTRSPFLCLFWGIIGSWIVDKCAEFLQEEILNHYINSPLWVYALGYPVAVLACIGWQAGTFGASMSPPPFRPLADGRARPSTLDDA